MDRKMPRSIVAAALCAAALSLAPRTAHAYDVNGIGLGADVGLAGPTGVALTFGLGRLELEVLAGLSLNLPDNGVLEPDMWISGGAFFILADGPQTNFLVGGRLGAILDTTSAVTGLGESELVSRGLVLIEVDMRVEHRFDEHFVMTGHVGMVVAIDPEGDPDFSLGLGNTGLVGGFGFRYFFDPLGESAPAAAAPAPAPARRAEPAAEPAAGTSESGGEQQPYWE